MFQLICAEDSQLTTRQFISAQQNLVTRGVPSFFKASIEWAFEELQTAFLARTEGTIIRQSLSAAVNHATKRLDQEGRKELWEKNFGEWYDRTYKEIDTWSAKQNVVDALKLLGKEDSWRAWRSSLPAIITCPFDRAQAIVTKNSRHGCERMREVARQRIGRKGWPASEAELDDPGVPWKASRFEEIGLGSRPIITALDVLEHSGVGPRAQVGSEDVIGVLMEAGYQLVNAESKIIPQHIPFPLPANLGPIPPILLHLDSSDIWSHHCALHAFLWAWPSEVPPPPSIAFKRLCRNCQQAGVDHLVSADDHPSLVTDW